MEKTASVTYKELSVFIFPEELGRFCFLLEKREHI